MCGICGAVSVDSKPPLDEIQLTRMRDSLIHRGPDDAGNYFGQGVSLASRRLAILDLSPKGHMPMATEDGRYQIVYNGEVYNFESLREELKSKGVSFRSGTDTEVLLNLFACEGPKMLERLNGMFAIAIWDTKERSLFLARDRVGVKPLHYAVDSKQLTFASEEKALFAAGLPAKFNPDRLEELIYFHYVAGEETPYAGIKRLLPGHYLVWKDGRIQISRWWNLAEKAMQPKPEILKDPESWLRETFDDAVKLRRISDVPVGVLLSGGLDSSSVAASMALENPGQVSGFTICFKEKEYDEGPLAQAVAARYKLNHHQLTIPIHQVQEHVSHAARFLDEPMTHASDIHLWMISAYAKSKVTVLLSGEGGDETMAGYGWYRTYRLLPLLKALKPLAIFSVFHPKIKKLKQFLTLDPKMQMMLRNFSETLPENLKYLGMPSFGFSFPYREKILLEAAALYPGEPVRQAMYYDQHTYLCSILDRNDKMTMAASIECRTPFLDYRLIEGLASLPTKQLIQGWKNKPLLRRALGQRLPPELLHQKKRGFDVPLDQFMRKNAFLKDQVRQLPDHPVWGSLNLDKKRMKQAIESFSNGEETHTLLLWHLLMITLWYDACIQGKKGPNS
jgi:asparagine synthase (glutamine-hydrolysing)